MSSDPSGDVPAYVQTPEQLAAAQPAPAPVVQAAVSQAQVAPVPQAPAAPVAPVATGPVAAPWQNGQQPAPIPAPAPETPAVVPTEPIQAAPAPTPIPAPIPAQAPQTVPEAPVAVAAPAAPVPAPAPAASAASPPGFIQSTGMDSDMGDPNRPTGGGQAGKRFWMPKGATKTIIFLSEGTGPAPYGPPVLYEHQPPIGQGKARWLNWFTCLEPLGVPCGLCEWAKNHDRTGGRYKGMFFTIVDLSEWVDGQGVKHTMTKKFLVAKKDTKEKIERKYMTRVEAGGGLRGAMFKVFRGNSDKAASVGDDFEFVQMCDLNSLPPEYQEPFDVATELGLNNPEKIKADVVAAVERMRVEAGEAAQSGQPAPPQGAGQAVTY